MLRVRATKLTDARLKLMYDSVSGIRTIKAYALEKIINVRLYYRKDKIKRVRRREVSLILCGNLLKTIHRTISIFSAYIAAAIIFLVKALQN